MIWITHLDPTPGEERLVSENFTGSRYKIEGGALVVYKEDGVLTFGPGFWVRVDEDTD